MPHLSRGIALFVVDNDDQRHVVFKLSLFFKSYFTVVAVNDTSFTLGQVAGTSLLIIQQETLVMRAKSNPVEPI